MAKKKTRRSVEQKNREIGGVLLIALGLFFGVCLYVSASGVVGTFVTGVMSGLTGVFSYVVPPLFFVLGIMLIAMSSKRSKKGRNWLVALGVLLLLTLIHVIGGAQTGDTKFFDFVIEAYREGSAAIKGGGALGALLCYPLLLYTGKAGVYIFTIAGLLIVLLLVTSLSLQKVGAQAGRTVKAGVQKVEEHRRQRQALYTASVAEEVPSPHKKKSERKEKKRAAQHGTRVKDTGDVVDFIPSQGPIARRPANVAGQDRPDPALSGQHPMSEEWLEQEDDFQFQQPESKDWLTEESVPLFEAEYEPLEPPVEEVEEQTYSWQDYQQQQEDDLPDNVTPFPMDRARTSNHSAGFQKEEEGELSDEAIEQTAQEIADAAQQAPKPYCPPPISILDRPKIKGFARNESPQEKGKLLIETLESFRISAKIVNIAVGPVITRFELQPAPGVRVNRITALADDIALALAAPRVRIEAPIPGKAAIGIEIPNKDTATVVLRDIVDSREFSSATSAVTMALGKDIAGNIVVADLGKMPHLLIAGATGSGKSVCINDIIISMVYKSSPADLRLILVDPKVVELSMFNTLPHLLNPVVTNPKKAAGALRWAVQEMIDRYQKFSQLGCRDLARYNDLQEDPTQRLPKIVVVIDELADLMMVAPDDVEDSICRIAQLGRASGIHLIVATQRPSADIITGLIKANIPSRIAFAVSSSIDSRIILDATGAEKLLGRGDMLFHPNGTNKPIRVQGAFVSDEEVERFTTFFKAQQNAPVFNSRLAEEIAAPAGGGSLHGEGKQEDELLGEAVRIVLDSGQASISMIQRRLRVGYARAARLVDMMEQAGYVSGFEGSKPRRVLITRDQYEATFGGNTEDEV